MPVACSDLRTHLADAGGRLTGTCPYCGGATVRDDGAEVVEEADHVEVVHL